MECQSAIRALACTDYHVTAILYVPVGQPCDRRRDPHASRAGRQENSATAALPQDTGLSVLVIVGPGGDWSKVEIAITEQIGVESITLGQHILRTEIVAISILQSCLGMLG